MVKELVNQIRDVAYEAEDVVDTYVADVTMHKSRNILGKLLHGKRHVMMLHDINENIEKINRTIDEIYKNKDRYGIGEGEFKSGDTEESLRKRRRDVEEEDVVGLVHDSNVVIENLTSTDSRLKVVPIIGMGGLGKTTLARKIYNDGQVKQVFPCRAWGYVSNDYRPKELLLSLLKCLTSSASQYQDLSEDNLKEKVGECLRGKKYLVVLDDIWKTETWDELKRAFPDDHQSGSRILITSRIKEVASYAGATFAYNLPLLNKEDSWKLFSKKAFPREECPSGIEDLSIFIYKGCGGLPLAIIVLAGIVAKKEKSQRERWLRSIKDHVNWHLTQDNDKVLNDILKLSYDSLHPRLKPCYLYLGIYPEDCEIPVRQLIHLWVAEGFIQPPQKSGILSAPEPEEVADGYLDELVDRSLVQVASRRSDGGVKTCRIHDLLRDLCISEGKDDKFLEICGESNIDAMGKSNPRRLSFHCRTQRYHSSNKSSKSWTRSLFFFGEVPTYNIDEEDKYANPNLKNFKLVRVLHSRQGYFRSPRDLKRMIHLRYLKIDEVFNVDLKTISASICSLWNLQTLQVLGTAVAVPRIWKLKELRHLYSSGIVFLPEDMLTSRADDKRMQNLQTLIWVALEPRTTSLVDNGSFPNLRKLGLRYIEYLDEDKFSAQELLQSLHRLSNLHTLKLYGTSELPLNVDAFPSNLTKITLKAFGSFNSRSMNTLGRLPSLRILKLSFAMRDDSLHCAAGEFPQLQVFQMRELGAISWSLDKGAMPRLRRLLIYRCHGLDKLPKELWCMTTLREVAVDLLFYQMLSRHQRVKVPNGCKLTFV